MIVPHPLPQDSTPAGTIFCEDVEDCVEDHAESRKDSKVILTTAYVSLTQHSLSVVLVTGHPPL